MDVDAAISGQAGHRGLRALLLGDGRDALRELLGSMLGRDRAPAACRLVRAHLKPARKLTACYDVTLDGAASATPVAVTWFRGGTVADADSLDAAEEELRRASLPTGFARLWATRPSWGRGPVPFAAPTGMRDWRVARSRANLALTQSAPRRLSL